MEMQPTLIKWGIVILPAGSNPAKESVYAAKIVEFMDNHQPGGRIDFEPEGSDEYTFSFYGRVYNRKGFEDGDSVATSAVSYIERMADDSFGDTYAVHTQNTVYLISGRESIGLLRIKAHR